MPEVNGKKYPYTAKGKADAASEKEKGKAEKPKQQIFASEKVADRMAFLKRNGIPQAESPMGNKPKPPLGRPGQNNKKQILRAKLASLSKKPK
jgi:hypothetical protein